MVTLSGFHEPFHHSFIVKQALSSLGRSLFRGHVHYFEWNHSLRFFFNYPSLRLLLYFMLLCLLRLLLLQLALFLELLLSHREVLEFFRLSSFWNVEVYRRFCFEWNIKIRILWERFVPSELWRLDVFSHLFNLTESNKRKERYLSNPIQLNFRFLIW